MKDCNPNEEWGIYEANVQSYRSNFLSSQSLLLAIGAITLEKNMWLTVIIALIAVIQIPVNHINTKNQCSDKITAA